MSETISIQFPDISGDATGHTAFIRDEAGTILDVGGAAITETGATGLWTFTLTGPRVSGVNYFVRVYSGATETAANIVYDGILYAGQTLVDKPFPPPVIFGTVGATAPATTSFTPSAVWPAGSAANQWLGRILVFENDTTTAALRGQATDITAATAAALPLLTFTALTNAPVSGDTFRVY
jgi:hypothetical protein